ncbi:MAG: hypothetical protein IBJ11_09930 [Phycisphaerales bacterium]|nr:hypothetical protein [Phycisphaerales bacterium]
MLIRDEHPPQPNIAFAGALAALRPAADAELRWDEPEHAVEARFSARDPDRPAVRRSAGGPIRFRVSTSGPEASDVPELGVRAGDFVAWNIVAPPSDADLAAATMRYEDAMSASPQELRRRFERRVVVIGDDRPPTEMKRSPDGRLIPGSAAIAAAMHAMIDGASLTSTGPGAAWLTALAASAAGAVLGVLAPFAHVRRLGLWMVLAAACVGVTAAVFALGGLFATPILPAVAALLGCEGLAQTLRCRGRSLLA